MQLQWRYIFQGGRRRLFFLLFDIFLSVFSYSCAVFIRLDGHIPPDVIGDLAVLLPVIVIVRVPCYVHQGLYQTLWRYLGVEELLAIIKSVTLGSLLILLGTFVLQVPIYTRSVFVIDWLVLIMCLGGSRISFKLLAERLRSPNRIYRKKVLILGAEDTGEQLVREFVKRPDLGYRPVGFLDNDPEKQGLRIHGVKVLGKLALLPQVIKVLKIDEVIIALPRMSGHEVREIVFCLNNLNISYRIIPNSSLLMKPDVLPLKLRRVEIADLLGRELLQDLPGIHEYFNDKKVLITGAGGSIGSELSRIIYQNNPKELVLVDYCEKYLHDLELEFEKGVKDGKVHSYMEDITNLPELEKIFAKHKPDIVYHAAACKQVPFVETHFEQGIKTNVFGTKALADLSDRHGVERFVLISTDKAINPRSIMGATKRVAEVYMQTLRESKTHFLTVRFGNVFNSNGSAIPLFRKQIESGGPVTVTHPEMTRYFMDVSEAVYLIIKATMIGKDSEVFILDMGKPVKILTLAKDLIRLMGLREDQIAIQYIGLRPGEKMHEEIQSQKELSIPTEHEKIRIWKSSEVFSAPQVRRRLEELNEMVGRGSKDGVISKLKEIVHEYTPWES